MKTIFEDMHQKYCPLKPKQEYLDAIKSSHEIIIAELSAHHRKLVVNMIDTKYALLAQAPPQVAVSSLGLALLSFIICDEHALESFKTGFTLAWQIMNELNNGKTNGRLFRNSDADDRLLFKERKMTMNIIEELYFGNVEPNGKAVKNDGKLDAQNMNSAVFLKLNYC